MLSQYLISGAVQMGRLLVSINLGQRPVDWRYYA